MGLKGIRKVKCELCKFPATLTCESDQASLCWDCDGKVHGANFLVARHSRSLLCGTCQSITPWTATGAKLCRIVAVCERCANEANEEDDDGYEESEADNYDDIETDDSDLDDDDDGNQVVPWSSAAPRPPVSSSSSSTSCGEQCAARFTHSDGEFFESANTSSLKRARESATDLRSLLQDDIHRSFSRRRRDDAALTTRGGGGTGEEASYVDEGFEIPERAVQAVDSRSAPIILTVKRIGEGNNEKLNKESEGR